MTDLYRRIKHRVGKAIGDFGLISDGDRVAVGLSGGKDSWTLLFILDELRKRAPIHYEVVGITIDSGYPGYQGDLVARHCREMGIPHHLIPTDHYRIIEEKRRPDSSYCSFCARLKRGALYEQVQRLGCNKLALGHHLDDFIETLLLNQFFVGSLKSMAASMLADNGVTTVIRPLVYVEESDIRRFARERGFPVICCRCPVCGEADMQRRRMKRLVEELSREIPAIRHSLLRAIGNVQPRHLLDRRLAGGGAGPAPSSGPTRSSTGGEG
ncbi:MAG: tRNA 2-thiocytidine(32) synthetase TtcA [Desulfuromonadia bacterium]